MRALNVKGECWVPLKNSLLWRSGVLTLDRLLHWARSKPPSLLTPPSPLGSWSRSKSIESCGTCSSGKPALMVYRSPMVLTFMPNRGTMIMPTMTATSELGTFAPIVPSRGHKNSTARHTAPTTSACLPEASFPMRFLPMRSFFGAPRALFLAMPCPRVLRAVVCRLPRFPRNLLAARRFGDQMATMGSFRLSLKRPRRTIT